MKKAELKMLFTDAGQAIAGFLPELSGMNERHVRNVIARYTAAIAGNFVPWMGAALVSSRSVQGRFACAENMYEEMKDDHPGMLDSFARHAHSSPTASDYISVQPMVHEVRRYVGQMDGLRNLALMAGLENTSNTFIPFLAECAQRMGSAHLTYTNTHGEADIAHADQFIWALEFESALHEDAHTKIQDTIQLSLRFWKHIFTQQ